MPSLPSLEECNFNANGNSVWTFLLEAEQEALTKSTLTDPRHNISVVAVRVLGFLLKDLWDNARRWNLGDTAYSQMAKKINFIRRGETEVRFDELVQMGLMYRNCFLCVFRSELEPTPMRDDFDDDPPASFEDMKEQIIQSMKNASHTEQDTRNQALFRDGFKCVVTGHYDYETWFLLEADERGPNERRSFTEAAYLFSASAQNVPKESPASVFTLLTMFGLGSQAESLYGHAFNSLQNVITLELSLHKLFDMFHLWLEPVAGQEDTYDVCGPIVDNRFNWATGPLPARIILKVDPSADAKAAEQRFALGLPNPCLIAIRAICARVSIKSGATEQMDQILEDLEDSTVLAGDGGMACLLAARLSMISEYY